MSDNSTITPKALATEMGIDPKALRRYLRNLAKSAESDTPGKGGNWAIPVEMVESIKSDFAARAARRTATPPAPPEG